MSVLLTPLQKAQGKIVKGGGKCPCPVHELATGKETDWTPLPRTGPTIKRV